MTTRDCPTPISEFYICPRCGVIQATHAPCLCHYRLTPPEKEPGLPSVALALVIGLALGVAVVVVICGLAWVASWTMGR